MTVNIAETNDIAEAGCVLCVCFRYVAYV